MNFYQEKKKYPDTLVGKIKSWKDDASESVGTWKTRQEKFHKLRMRIKKAKSFPFIGCSNIRIPTIEIKLRKLKAALVNSIFGIRPIVQVIPSPSGNYETAQKIEKFLDHLMMDVMKIKNKLIIAIDQMLEKGFFLLKPYWVTEITTRVEKVSLKDLTLDECIWLFNIEKTPQEIYQVVSERFNVDLSELVALRNRKEIEEKTDELLNGAEEVEFEFQDVLKNQPDFALCAPERVYVPTTSGFDPQDSQYLIHEFYIPFDQVKSNAKHKGWDAESVQKINDKKTVDLSENKIDVTKDEREGIQRLQTSNLVKIWECYCNYDINGDKTVEKCVVTVAPDFDVELRKVTIPYYSGKFPFVKLFYELIDDRWFSHRGIPELIEDIVKEIDTVHMQKIDRMTLSNSPMFLYRAGVVNPKTVQFQFGQGIPVHGMQDLSNSIAPFNAHNPNVDFSYKDEQFILESKVEEIIGQVDYTLQSMINKREPRTASEVQMQAQNQQTVFGLDSSLLRGQIEELFNWVYELFCLYGNDETVFQYFGENGYENIKITKEEFQTVAKITVRGNDSNTNQVVRQQKADFIMRDTYQALQMGLVDPIAVMNARKRAYHELQIENPEEFLIPLQQRQEPPVDNVSINMSDLTDAERAQILMKKGIRPDVKGRMMNEQNRRDELEFEQLEKTAKAIR